MINNENSIQLPQKHSKRRLMLTQLVQNTLKLLPFKWLWRCSNVVGTSSDVFVFFRKWSEIFVSHRDVFGNPSHDKTKSSRVWLRKSWLVYFQLGVSLSQGNLIAGECSRTNCGLIDWITTKSLYRLWAVLLAGFCFEMWIIISLYSSWRDRVFRSWAQLVRVLSKIYRLGEKSRVAEGHELPRGVRGHAPPGIFLNEYALRCNLVHFDTQFWEMLQWYFILFFSRDHVLTMLHLAPIFFGGKLGILGRKLLPLKYPR